MLAIPFVNFPLFLDNVHFCLNTMYLLLIECVNSGASGLQGDHGLA